MKSLKILFILVCSLFVYNECYSQSCSYFKTTVSIDDVWDDWKTCLNYFKGDWHEFRIYSHQPWNAILRVKLDTQSRLIPGVKYTGIVEYWVHDPAPTIEVQLRNNYGMFLDPYYYKSNNPRKVTSKCTFMLIPDKKGNKQNGLVSNMWFDGVGFAIDLRGCDVKQ